MARLRVNSLCRRRGVSQGGDVDGPVRLWDHPVEFRGNGVVDLDGGTLEVITYVTRFPFFCFCGARRL